MRIKNRRVFPSVAILSLLILAGCDDDGPPVCTAEFVYGISLHVTDGITEEAAAEGAIGMIKDGDFVDTLEILAPEEMVGAGERAGVYSIALRKPGYANWDTSGVEVTAGICHVRPVVLDVALVPLQ